MAQKIADAINAVLGCPVIATVVGAVLTLKTKWKGVTSKETKTSFTNGGVPAGITYANTSTTDGAGAVNIAGALAQFGTDWYTHVINPYGSATLTSLEQFNGVPDPSFKTYCS